MVGGSVVGGIVVGGIVVGGSVGLTEQKSERISCPLRH